MRQISLTMPKNLFEASKEYSEQFGYRNVQEFILELLRQEVFMQNIMKYKKIEAEMKRGKGVRRFNQKQAKEYLKKL